MNSNPVATGHFLWLERWIKKLSFTGVWALYLVIAIEFLYMFSPLAFYGYFVNGAALGFFNRFSSTRWLIRGVFNPQLHFWPHHLGILLILAGLLIFLAGYIQVLSSRLRKRGLVDSFLYKRIRHPQYTGAGMVGFGIFLNMPRFVVLILLVMMLNLYFLLARREEKICLSAFGEEYRSYMARTAMFIPGLSNRLLRDMGIADTLFKPRLVRVGLNVLILLLVVGTGFGLRSMTRGIPASIFEDTVVVQLYPHFLYKHLSVLPILPLSDEEMGEALRIIKNDPRVGEKISPAKEAGHGLLVYTLPEFEKRGHTIFEIREVTGADGDPLPANEYFKQKIRPRILITVTFDRKYREVAGIRDNLACVYGPQPPLPGGMGGYNF